MSEIEMLKAENVKSIRVINALKAENFGYVQTIKEQSTLIYRLKAENSSLPGQQLPAFIHHSHRQQFRNTQNVYA